MIIQKFEWDDNMDNERRYKEYVGSCNGVFGKAIVCHPSDFEESLNTIYFQVVVWSLISGYHVSSVQEVCMIDLLSPDLEGRVREELRLMLANFTLDATSDDDWSAGRERIENGIWKINRETPQ